MVAWVGAVDPAISHSGSFAVHFAMDLILDLQIKVHFSGSKMNIFVEIARS
jgi:hypothetical protein